ncbi:MAG: EF-hand domain-containing protein [Kangiellaceae bacterium]|jgi:Ca2+-binding EF-hand superfamily protein|nr:EF-hand domain-containing protein [Kangiellaceae bacterium]
MSDTKQIPTEQLVEIEENFAFFDRDSNNEIDLGEFTKLLRVISPTATLEQAQKGFQLIDENQDGHIDFDEFLGWWKTCWWEY